ncbi:MAG: DMT family transporter [Pseudomonadota bacterium]|nr:DMT family transporter [Gammaproteobacteria bacterium]MDQ3580442.1 DMT family transporter [Pseudomonadota bacterium]
MRGRPRIPVPSSPTVRGALCALGASLMMALMGAAVRMASTEIPNEMVVFLRNAFGLLALWPWIRRVGLSGLATDQWPGHLLRSLTGLSAMYCFFYAIARLDLAQAVLLNFSAPLYIAPIAWLWLGEAITGRLMLSALIGFAGVALILKPGTAPFSTDAAIGAFSGLLAAVAMVSLRSMAPSEPPVRAVVYFSAIGTVVSAVPLIWAWETPAPLTLLIMGAAGIFATLGQILLTTAYLLAPAARVGPYTYSTVIFATLIGWVFWHEVPDRMSIAGALLVCLAGILAVARAKAPQIEYPAT